MIIDQLENWRLYARLSPRLARALGFLNTAEAEQLEPAPGQTLRHPIEHDDVFALVQRYRTKSMSESFWEAHRTYIDVQCMYEGVEQMGYAALASMNVKQPYDAKRDFVMLDPKDVDAGQFITLRAGTFAIFFPTDAHMPSLCVPDSDPREVKKIVVKVRI